MATDEMIATNRATVALVDAKVGIVDAKVDGVAALIKAENATTRELIAGLQDLPAHVAALRTALEALDEREKQADATMDRRVSALEDDNEDDRSFWRRDVPMIVLTLALVVVTALTLLHG